MAGSLNQDQFSLRTERLGDRAEIRSIDILHLDSLSREDLLQETNGSAIQIVTGDYFLAALHQSAQRGNCRHAAGKSICIPAAFEVGQLLVQQSTGGIAAPGVIVLPRFRSTRLPE